MTLLPAQLRRPVLCAGGDLDFAHFFVNLGGEDLRGRACLLSHHYSTVCPSRPSCTSTGGQQFLSAARWIWILGATERSPQEKRTKGGGRQIDRQRACLTCCRRIERHYVMRSGRRWGRCQLKVRRSVESSSTALGFEVRSGTVATNLSLAGKSCSSDCGGGSTPW